MSPFNTSDSGFDESVFAEYMKTESLFFGIPTAPLDKEAFLKNKKPYFREKYQYLLALVFGLYGFEKDYDKVEEICLRSLRPFEKKKKAAFHKEEYRYGRWLDFYASYSVILGTAYGMQGEYKRAVYHFMQALKTDAIRLSDLLCEYIKFCAEKLSEYPCEELELDGAGSSKDMPMGGTANSDGEFAPSVNSYVISDLEGAGGTVVAFFKEKDHTYGILERKGSTSGSSFTHMIDIYETFVIDRRYRLYKIRLYYNSYYSREQNPELALPKGFHVLPYSRSYFLFKLI